MEAHVPVVPPHHDQDVPCTQIPPARPLPEPAQHIQGPSPQAPSLCQPHPPVPHAQQLPYMVAPPPSILPEGAVPGAEGVAVPQTITQTWRDLDDIIHTARSLKASVGLRKDTLVPDTVTKRLAVAAASLKEAAQELEQWMQGPDGWDPVEAAKAGRLKCLQRLHKEGRFLDLYSPHRAAAGEARRAEVWLAALAACEAGHAHVLRWLFRGGWPPSFDAEPPWHLRDVAESWIKHFGTGPKLDSGDLANDGLSRCWWQPELTCYPPEVKLYRSAMRAPACLDALLEVGFRSAWICRAALLEGRADLLRLALARGCPCDAECLLFAAREGQVAVLEEVLGLGLDSLLETTNRLLPNDQVRCPGTRSAANLVQQAGMEAAYGGEEACLEALLRWHPDLLCGPSAIAHAAARAGSLNCLQLLHRAGFKEWRGTTQVAAGKPDNLPCLLFALQLEFPPLGPRPSADDGSCAAIEEAAWAGSVANLKALHEAGCHWTGEEVGDAIYSSNMDAVNFCLQHAPVGVDVGEVDWSFAMEAAIVMREKQFMQLLYEAGFPPEGMIGGEHPAVLAIGSAWLEGAQVAVEHSGTPELQWRDTEKAIRGGEALLRYVHGLGGTVHKGTAEAAAEGGQLGALRYSIESGAPWDCGTLVAAMVGDSLECLRYAHEGCPQHTPEEPPVFPAARSLPVLRYICEHMGPTWSAGVLRKTAMQLADSIRGPKAWERLDWQMALYTVQQFVRSGEPGRGWGNLPAPLAAAVLVRRERAAALAGAFFKAGQLAQVWAAHPWAPVWRSMAGLPSELLHRIAFMAHLALPPAPLC